MSLNFAELFDESYYLATNPDVALALASDAFTSGLDHFTRFGRLEGRDPSAFFDTKYYLSTNPDIGVAIAAGTIPSAIDHFVQFGQTEGREPIFLFDSNYYLAKNPDVAQAVAAGIFSSAYDHFLEFGQRESRSFGPFFDTNYYLSTNPDVAQAVAAGTIRSAVSHFLQFGQVERRDPTPLFDSDYYLAQNLDVAQAVAAGAFNSGYEHFALFGQGENRSPSPAFDGRAYLARYTDVAQAVAAGIFKSAFEHFALFGQAENRLGVNAAPVVGNQAITTNEDVAITVNGLLNTSDSNGDAIAIASVGPAANGTVTINQDGTLSYTPNLNFNGSDTFTYTVADAFGGTAIATVSVLVNPLPDVPIATNDTVSTSEDTRLTISSNLLFTNDIEPDGQTLLITGFTQPANGSVVGNGDGTYVYTPNANFNGTESFTYTVTDGLDGSATATVTISVGAVNDTPTPGSDSLTTNEDTSLSFTQANLLTNDSDVEDGLLTVTSFTQPTSGSLARDNNGNYLYTPAPNFNGSASFTYTVTDSNGSSAIATANLVMNSVNDLPLVGSNTATTVEDTALTLNATDLLANDSDTEIGELLITSFTQPGNGSLVGNNNGTYLYTPNSNFNGSDSFTYTVTDSNGGTASSTVTLSVTSVNDLPIATGDSFSLDEDGTLTITANNLLLNDRDADGTPLLITNFTAASKGQLVDRGGNTYLYTPEPGFSGSDSFTYTITDGTSNNATAVAVVTLTVNAVNDIPIVGNDAFTTNEDTVLTLNATNLLTNDSDVEGEPLAIVSFSQPTNGSVMGFGNGTYLYMPKADFSGSDSFTYTVRDGVGATAVANVNLTVVKDTNVPPIALDDFVTTNEDTAIASFNAFANDTDVENTPLTLVSFTTPDQGTVTFSEEGVFTYQPNFGFNGSDSFSYTVKDGNNATASATVRIGVNAVNDAPVLNPEAAPLLTAIAPTATDSPGNMVFELLGTQVTDSDVGALSGIAITEANDASGTWQYSLDSGSNWTDISGVSEKSAQLLAGEELIRFQPEPNFLGLATFTFHAWDLTDGQNGETIDLTTSGVGGSSAFSSGTETAMLPVVIGGIVLDPLPGTGSGI
ncbi:MULTISPECIES: cadherin-like domain-containing protein [Trichocoleus]|uniref:Cadherin-like domain-containing protein n=1 Tax=Trichocoleus desertorum GB2-A4 TaxID=2933944 RepID=A0ABV0JE71_9CYAN|nr:cadherin-like domain-containing protein [Trichocoleus sp. FACHB-46]MBD1862995.1 tandem-95 repeat protein [Trichocoleus sp. FACHB-46]